MDAITVRKPDYATPPKYNAEPLSKTCVTILQQLFRVDRDGANQSRAHSQHAVSEHRHLEVCECECACACVCVCVREGESMETWYVAVARRNRSST
jgi:hypothetical protein